MIVLSDATVRKITRENYLSPLHINASVGGPKICKLLLARDEHLVRTRSSEHMTPLHKACQNGRVIIAKILLQKYVQQIFATFFHFLNCKMEPKAGIANNNRLAYIGPHQIIIINVLRPQAKNFGVYFSCLMRAFKCLCIAIWPFSSCNCLH